MTALRCPLCREPLATDEKSATCNNRHSFDRAREGYFNLLPVQKKNSLDPGDDADMVAARHAFLEAGFYAPLRDTLMGLIAPLHPRHLLDSGCGEGWYTTTFDKLARSTTAFDISKSAVRRAAKGRPGITWLVASSNDIPLPDASVDVMTAIFSPVNTTEAARVMKPGALLLIAAPGEQHLWELRDALYAEVRAHQAGKWQEELSPHFQLQAETHVQFPLELSDNTRLQQLLKMTPHYWRASRERRNAVEQLPAFSTQADFRLLGFRKT